MLSLVREGEEESLRVEQRAEAGTRWAHSGVVEYQVVQTFSLSLIIYPQVTRGEEAYTNDVLTVTATIPALGIVAVRKFRRIKTNQPDNDRLRRHSVL